MVGVLVDYGVGADAGGFDVKTSKGETINFAVGNKMMINGAHVQCTAPTYECPNWPSSIVLGTSQVKVTYWNTVNLIGDSIKASSQIDLVTP